MVLDAAGLQISAASYTAAVDAAELDVHDTGLRVDARGLDTVYRSFDVVDKSRMVRVVGAVLSIVDERLGMPNVCRKCRRASPGRRRVLRSSRRGNLHLRRATRRLQYLRAAFGAAAARTYSSGHAQP